VCLASQDDRELLTTVAPNDRMSPIRQYPTQQCRHMLDCLVSALMAVGIVDLLEVVDIANEGRKLIATGDCLLDEYGSSSVEAPSIQQSGQRVLLGNDIQLRACLIEFAHRVQKSVEENSTHGPRDQYREEDTFHPDFVYMPSFVGITACNQVEGEDRKKDRQNDRSDCQNDQGDAHLGLRAHRKILQHGTASSAVREASERLFSVNNERCSSKTRPRS
jgi:hypothetical protein